MYNKPDTMESPLSQQSLVSLYTNFGLSTVEIAQRLGISSGSVYVALRRLGIQMRSRGEASKIRYKRTHTLPWEKIATEYKTGATIEDLSKKYVVANTTVSHHLRRLGVDIRKKGNRPGGSSGAIIKFDVDAAVALNKAGKTLTQIAGDLGVTYSTLRYRFNSIGYKPRDDLRAKSEVAKSYVYEKRKVLEALGTEACMICGETRVIDLCHIASKKEGHALTVENTLVLCPLHHRLFDHGKLTEVEFEKIQTKLLAAARRGLTHSHYKVL